MAGVTKPKLGFGGGWPMMERGVDVVLLVELVVALKISDDEADDNGILLAPLVIMSLLLPVLLLLLLVGDV